MTFIQHRGTEPVDAILDGHGPLEASREKSTIHHNRTENKCKNPFWIPKGKVFIPRTHMWFESRLGCDALRANFSLMDDFFRDHVGI